MTERKLSSADYLRDFARQNPRFSTAIVMDARAFAKGRGERVKIQTRTDAVLQILRLCWVTDAFTSLLFHRLKVSLYARGIPVIPMVLHKLSNLLGSVQIGRPVIMEGGVYMPHGYVVIDGMTKIGSGAVIRPFVTIGLKDGDFNGPVLGRDVSVGTGAKIIGPVSIGDAARIGAGAVVTADVPAGRTAVGVPARLAD
ncbi:MAG: hypothetical protein AAFV54_05285 [Pseudomonadota bacterium]